MSRVRISSFNGVFGVVALMYSVGAIADTGYQLIDLGSAFPRDLNDANQVVVSIGGEIQVWDSGTFTNLGKIDGNTSIPSALNSDGDIVGSVNASSGTCSFGPCGFTLINDVGEIIPPMPATPYVTGVDINESGLILATINGPGSANNAWGLQQKPATIQNGVVTEITTPAYAYDVLAQAINSSGDVVGFYHDEAWLNGPIAFKIVSGVFSALGNGQQNSIRYWDINDSGQIAGWRDNQPCLNVSNNTCSTNPPPATEWGVLWEADGTSTLMDAMGQYSDASGVNNQGQVVGRYYDAGNYAFVFDNGEQKDLTSLLIDAPGWVVTAAYDINNNGYITGRATPPGGGNTYVVLAPAQSVDIDVLPGDSANIVYPNRAGNLPVAVLSSANFDATQIDPATLRFGLAEIAPNAGSIEVENVDGQHGDDLTATYRADLAGIFCNDTEVSLTGETYAGESVIGTDSIDASNCEDGGCHVY